MVEYRDKNDKQKVLKCDAFKYLFCIKNNTVIYTNNYMW